MPRTVANEASLERIRGVTDIALRVPRVWGLAMVFAAVVSTIELDRVPNGDVTAGFHPTTLTAVILALIWLPPLIRVVALAGGAIKTPAGEARTSGLLQIIKMLDPETKEETLSQLVLALSSAEVVSDPERREATQPFRQDLEAELQATSRQTGGVRETLDAYAREYERLRSTQPSGRERTLRMTSLVAEARATARIAPISAADLGHMLTAGSDGDRVVALAIAQDHPNRALLDGVRDCILNSRSAFEQFQALAAAIELLPLLHSAERRALAAAVRAAMDDPERDIPSDSSRSRLARAILRATGDPGDIQ